MTPKVDIHKIVLTKEILENTTTSIGKSGGRYFILPQDVKVSYKTLVSKLYANAKAQNADKAAIKELYQNITRLNDKAQSELSEQSKNSFKISLLTKIRQFFGNLFSNRKKQLEFLDEFTGIKLQNNEGKSAGEKEELSKLSIPELQTKVPETQEDIEKVKKLIADKKNNEPINGVLPVYQACKSGHLESVKLLINPQNVNAKDAAGRTLLHYAVSSGNHELIKLLIEQGADSGIFDNDGFSPIHCADLLNAESIKLLINPQNVNAQNKYGATLLHLSALRGNQELIEFLLKNGADPEIRNKNGNLAIHLIPLNSPTNVDGFKLLVAKTKDINTPGLGGYSALDKASSMNRIDYVTVLLEKGANPNQPGQKGELALHLAAQFGYLDIVKLLVAKMSSDKINHKDAEGRTPLAMAQKDTSAQKDEIIKFLKENGAQ